MSNSDSDSETASLLSFYNTKPALKKMSNSNSEDVNLDHSGHKTKDDQLVVEEPTINQDYYEYMAHVSEVRPISVTENIKWNLMSSISKIFWAIGTLLNMLSLTVLSLRIDRLADLNYVLNHWKHYSVMILITIAGWLIQVLDFFNPGLITVTPVTAYVICTIGLLYYMFSVGLFLRYFAGILRKKYGKATTLRIWEIYVSIAWQMQTVGFSYLTLKNLEQPYIDIFKDIPTEVTTVIGVILVICGLGSKCAAIYGTGYNTYYWYDMVLNVPNAYFIEQGIYKFCGSPTYTLGRLTGFGAAINFRSIPLFLASIADLILITLFNYVVEQPFVKRMYMNSNEKQNV